MESEQQTYLKNPGRRYVEINPAIIALQRLIVRQYEQFVQQSSQSQYRSAASHNPVGDAPDAAQPEQVSGGFVR
jgi:renierapurpurin 18,18'-hydroxylase